mgnify:CR=1 FL=1
MLLSTLYTHITTSLTPLYGETEARAIARLTLETCCHATMTDILLGREAEGWEPAVLHRLLNGEPVQYVLGHTTFCGLAVKTDSRALIPRPETEALPAFVLRSTPPDGAVLDVCVIFAVHFGHDVAQLVNDLSIDNLVDQVDVCTGSGCIALACKHSLPTARVEAWDISTVALALAEENFRFHGLDVATRKVDLLDEATWPVPSFLTAGGGLSLTPAVSAEADAGCHEPFSAIVSNPPYVLERESKDIYPHVLLHEPSLALFVPDDDPLRFYRPLARLAHRYLRPRGLLAVECNTAYTDAVAELFLSSGLTNAEVLPDCFDRPRFVCAEKG